MEGKLTCHLRALRQTKTGTPQIILFLSPPPQSSGGLFRSSSPLQCDCCFSLAIDWGLSVYHLKPVDRQSAPWLLTRRKTISVLNVTGRHSTWMERRQKMLRRRSQSNGIAPTRYITPQHRLAMGMTTAMSRRTAVMLTTVQSPVPPSVMASSTAVMLQYAQSRTATKIIARTPTRSALMNTASALAPT